VSLHLSPEVRDEVLSLYAQQQRQEERGSRLDADRQGQEAEELEEKIDPPLPEHVVDEVLAGGRKDEPAQAVQQNEKETEGDELPARPDNLVESALQAGAGDLGLL